MRTLTVLLALTLIFGVADAARKTSPAQAKRFLVEFRDAVEKINRTHLKSPAETTEEELKKKLPKVLVKGIDHLLAMEDGDAKWDALVEYIGIAADLDLIEGIAKAEKELRKKAPEKAGKAGHYISRDRFLLHALRVNDEFATDFAGVFEGILEVYDRTFGFEEFSKVPGKKIRVELHREDRPRPPHFAPQFPFHSTVDFPVASDAAFRSPTPDGKFYFYGLCHEFGHLIAMWGGRGNQEDHHAWAHYTGVTLVDACEKAPWAKQFRDRRGRSLEKERERLKDTAPSAADRDGVLKLFVSLHDLVGPKRIGAALNLMEEKGMGHRINKVRYYSLADFEKALLAGSKSRGEKGRIKKLFE